jgi:uncharacterized protein YpbB
LQYIDNIILYCLKQLNGERTIYSIYHLLNGKKSSQTIQDAHLYSIKQFFRIFESLTRESFEEVIENLVDKQWICVCGDHRYVLTESGKIQLEKNSLPHYINGWKNHQLTFPFWERLSLFIQVVSNFVFQETHYIPIQKNKEVHIWLKSALKDINVPRGEIGKVLFSELVECLERAENINPLVIVYRLTGYRQIGLTSLQTAKRLNLGVFDYHFAFINVLHYLIQRVESDREHFRLLSLFLGDIENKDSLTLSSRKTLDYLHHGYSIDQIAQIRNLKLNTIEDHLVELALNVEDFSIDFYVDKNLQNEVIEISRQAATRQLKVIRNNLATASYFQIRLVLAKYGDR